jgi:polysaccharide export outer membrane protein
VCPRFKEESKMKLLLVPMLLVLAAVAQVVRIQRVVAEEPQQPPASRSWSLTEEFSIPLAERLEKTKRRHAQLIAERQLHLDAAKSSNLPAAQAVSHSGPPLSQEQIDFDRLTKEFENFACMAYVIEPPDILSIESDKLVPKASHCLETFDELQIRVSGALPEQSIDDVYTVDADGAVNLGLTYGRIAVVGQTSKEAEDAIRAQLSKILTDFDVTVSLLASSSAQAITGQHLVAMDGRVNLGVYGSVYVAGMTRKEARAAIELKLTERLDDPKVLVDVLAYNSKVYYVITKGARLGDDVTRMSIPFPVDGKENVAKALARDYGDADRKLTLSELASASLRLLRPAPNGGEERIYPIVWDPSAQAPTPLTNHGILPGDRIFVELTPAATEKRENELHSAYGPPPAEIDPPQAIGNYYDQVRPLLEKPYCLQPYDTVKLRVARPHRPAHALTWGDLEGEFTVNHHGEIEFAHATKGVAVAVAGMTVSEARDAIEQQLRKESPGCELQLTLSTLAAEKYVISIQRADGTELAVGALRPDYLSKSGFLEWSYFRSFIAELTPIGEVKLERASPQGGVESIELSTVWEVIQSPQMPAIEHHIRAGDRLIITVADDWEPQVYPSWLEPLVGGRPGQTRYRLGPGWSPAFNTQFDHPDVQRPATKYSR